MPDLPIAPDESSGEPRCQRSCPSWGTSDARRYGHCAHPEQGTQRVIGDLCHPRVRELVAISRRRCDGCIRYECGTAMHGHCPIRGDAPPPDGVCENWEANP